MTHSAFQLDEDIYPRSRFVSTTVGSGAQVVASGALRVHSYIFTAGAAGGTLILRGVNGGGEYTRLKVLVGDSKPVPMGFYAASGLEVLTTTSGGDFPVTVWYR